MTVVVNAAFRSQRITGQQRYATEIADRLKPREGFAETGPTGRWAGSVAREWAWVLTRLPRIAGQGTTLSLTARAPLGARQVITVHDLFVLSNPEWYSRRYVATHAPLLRAHLRSAAAVVTVSDPVADQLRAHYDGEIVVAPNAPSSVFADAAPRGEELPEALSRRGLQPDGYLLTVGSADPRKNLRALADAFAGLSEAERSAMPLVVVGGEAAIYREGRTDWPEQVVTTGYVHDDELRDLYAHARAVVFPTLAEGFGLPLVEAAAAGTRGLVVSDIPVFRWICGDGARYVDPGSIASIAAGLRAALAGEVPPIRVERRFDWDVSADAIASLCARVAEAGR